MTRRLLLLIITASLTLSCASRRLATQNCTDVPSAGSAVTCSVPGYDDRDYDMVIPTQYNKEVAAPLIIAIHGGGGNRKAALSGTCPEGKIDDAQCLHKMANQRGYVVVSPDGNPAKMLNLRTWNAGGGTGDWRCTSGIACEENADDVSYFDALIDDVTSRVNIDENRIFVTGLSNGGAMSFRLACELPRIRGAAPIGGAMQLTTSSECKPAQPPPMLYIHGTTDPCWQYQGGESQCPVGQEGKKHVSAQRTIDEWKALANCQPDPLVTDGWKDSMTDDDIMTQLQQFQGCSAEFTHLQIIGGGHTWPNGHAYLGETTIGPVSRDWGNEVLLDFFDRHR